jgi:cytochrome c biogenesis protein CcmG, thiol:disulfide interchange protein DsbE
MSKSLKALVPLVLFLGLAALLFYGLGTDPRKVPSPLVGKPAPEFNLPALLDPGRTVSSTDLEGKVTLLNVWFSSCVSCRAEHRELMRIAREGGFQIVGLNWKDDKGAAIQMLRQFGNPYSLIAVDEAGRVGIDWGVYGAPETFVVDPEGIIRYKQIGPIDQEVWEQTLRPLVEKIKAEGRA